MKKIGILTFHTALNYGAVFQTYALQQFLNKINVNNEIVDYHCEYIEKNYKPFYISDGKILYALVRGFLFGHLIKLKRKRFNDFIDRYMVMSKPYYSAEDIEKIRDNYSFFISGSDQVWSPIAAGFDAVYFLPFARDDQKFSYAASIGTSYLSDKQLEEYRERLEGFSVLSVREYSAKKILTRIDNSREIIIHVDPTLLLKEEEWKKMCGKKPDNVPNDYLLLFNVEKPINDICFAKKLAKERGLKVVYINDRTLKKDKDIIYLQALSPEVFLSLFANAKIVVSNSFHGTVFSIIFHKEFYVELENKKQRNVRVEGLLNELNIHNVEINEYESNRNRIVNWNDISFILDEKRKESERYFMRMIESKS